jgi:hypothetical protein
MWLNRTKATLFLVLLAAACVCFVASFIGGQRSKWLTSAGLLFELAGIVQLVLGELWDYLVRKYSDEKKYPYGPPSHITRKLSEEADSPVPASVRDALFYNVQTGFHLIVLGCALQLAGVWV